MENAFYYLYETTNLTRKEKGLNPYLYDGQHCTHDLEEKEYFGSCRELKKDIKNGDEYQVEILKFFDNIFDLGDAEYNEIKLRNCIKDIRYYNNANYRHYNTNFEYGISQKALEKLLGRNLSEMHKQNIGRGVLGKNKGHKHTIEFSKNISNRMKGTSSFKNKHHTEKTKNIIRIKTKEAMKNIPMTEERRYNCGKGQRGKKRIFSNEWKTNMSLSKLGKKRGKYNKIKNGTI